MYKKGIYKILANEPLTATVWRMVLGGDTQWITAPGQFVDIALEGRYLRRPISVCDYDATTLTLIYKVVGEGTAQMSRMVAGRELDLLTGLGNGFDVHNAAQRPLLVGGGVGVPPLYNLAKVLLAAGKRVGVVLGFNTADEIFYADEFRALGCDVDLAHGRRFGGSQGFRHDGHRRVPPRVRLFLCLRAAADAAGIVRRCAAGRAALVRRAHGLRFRGLHGLFVQNQVRQQAHLQGGARINERRGHMVNKQFIAQNRPAEKPAADMSVSLSGLRLDNPVVPASGTFGYGNEFRDFYDINILGSFSFKGTTRDARFGNPTPRIAECTAGMINAVGLQNPGIDAVIAEELPRLKTFFHKPVIANISGFSIEEYAYCCERIDREPQVGIIEVNVSCPNVRHGGMSFGTSPECAAEVTRAVKAVTTKPVYIKLSPNVTDIVSIARACEEAGADGICLINTLLGMRIDVRKRKAVIANTMGGFSGAAVFPVAVRMVYQVAKACKIPVMGCGGVTTARDVIEMMMAGATAVQVGAANLANPYASKEIVEALPAEMQRLGIGRLSDIIGIVE